MSSENSKRKDRGRAFWCVVLVLAVVFGCGHAVSVARYLDRVNRETFQTASAATEARKITLGVAVDGRTWLRLTEERIARGEWRLSRTRIDGGPERREVFWHSAWSWWLEALGRLRAIGTGEDLPRAIEAASVWAQLPLWLLVVCGGAWWTARLWGFGAAAVFVATLAGHRGLYVAFYPAYPDHHGLIATAALGTVLGWLATDFGCGVRSSDGSKPVIFSAVSGAIGLAISAASLVPVLGGLGIVAIICRNTAVRAVGAERVLRGARLWRLWGRVGAGVAFVLYVLEFAPDRLGWRLEANHPVYALAWLGGAELVGWWWRRGVSLERKRCEWILPTLALVAVCAPLLVLTVGRGAVFAPVDAFVAGVHRHITEFYPLWEMSGSAPWLLVLSLLPLALAPFAWARSSGAVRVALLGVIILTGGLMALAVVQHRWWSLAAAVQAPLAALVAGAFLPRLREWRHAGAVVVLLAIALPSPVLLVAEQVRIARAGDVQAADAMQLLYRELGLGLRQAVSGKRPVLLTAPETSVGVGFYGDFRTIGTLYWENADGLRSAARVLTATDDAAAAQELRRIGATHLLLVEPGDFTAQYLDAIRAEGNGPRPALASTLGRRLLEGREVPAWARALPYVVPPQFGRLGVRVALYAFEPDSSLAESRRALGVARLVSGEEATGRAALREAARLGSAEAALILAWRLATAVRLSPAEADEALNLAAGAVAALPEAAAHRRVLAACFAAAHRWPEAQATVLRALDLAQEAGDSRAVAELERDFVRYRDFHPPFESSGRP